MRRSAALAVAAAVALGAPAAAFAQSPTDNQYTDPCANGACDSGSGSGSGTGNTSSSGTQSSGSTSNSSGTTAGTSTPTTTATPTSTSTGSSSSGSSRTLPYTGTDSGLVAALGGGFLLAGATLRRRTRRPR